MRIKLVDLLGRRVQSRLNSDVKYLITVVGKINNGNYEIRVDNIAYSLQTFNEYWKLLPKEKCNCRPKKLIFDENIDEWIDDDYTDLL